ncbi:PASTA domain-containing protein [Micromonospora sp. NPDC023956]|uniref:PASTA domain-containing protein n=1 Tax=Micromonospora sp. NPDC023956 TaxID=3155722 RepID=UPI003407B463
MSDDRHESWTGEVPGNGPGRIPPSDGSPPPRGRDGAGRAESAAAGDPTRVRPAAVWSGRAEVPPPRSLRQPETPTDWYDEEHGDRRWWMPILVASVALAVLAVLGLGLWLVVRSGPGGTPSAPLPSPSAEPPTAGPSTPPGTGVATTPARVPMPDLVGLPRSVAEATLDRLGLGYRSELRTSGRPAGTVIGTEPQAGERVPLGTDVTLVVSEGGDPVRPSTAVPTPSPTPAPTRTPTTGATGRAVTTSGGATPR